AGDGAPRRPRLRAARRGARPARADAARTAAVPRGLSLARGAAGLPPAAWVLFAGTFVNRFGGLVLSLRQRGYSAAEAGLALSAYGAGSLAASAAGGHLADRIGRRNAIALSMFA